MIKFKRKNHRIVYLVRLLTIIGLLTILTAGIASSASYGHAIEPFLDDTQFTSEAMILIDAKTGSILYAKNEKDELYPASITKIMTALLALELGQLDESVTTSKLARHAIGNRIYLEEGEEKPLGDLLYGLMLNSGNDAAIAIAEHIGGSVEGFSDLMNERAEQLGALQTNFITPNGLHDDQHYTTAQDMAIITRTAMLNPLFREIVSTKHMPWFGEVWHSSLVNSNKLLWKYEGSTGIKTGYTRKAQQTIVASAEKDGTELIAVLLKVQGRNNLWREATELLDFGFGFYETKQVKAKGEIIPILINGEEQQLRVADDIFITVEKIDGPEETQDEIAIKQSWTVEAVIDSLPYSHPPRLPGDEIGILKIIVAGEIVAQERLLLTKTLNSAASALDGPQSNLEINSEEEVLFHSQAHFSGIQILYVPLLFIAFIWWHQTKVIARSYRDNKPNNQEQRL
jgi:D-alanyl-D-alanine carboxypeptidase (penicillin-binding protein 5/6)